MNLLNDIKMPKIKLDKYKFGKSLDIENLDKEIEKAEKEKNNKSKNRNKKYNAIEYDTIRDMFHEVIFKYSDNVAILEKFNPKGKFEEISYKTFGEDVRNLGNGFLSYLGLKGKKVAIIGETTYNWYLTYMTLLCSGIIAVPIDKELPSNEIENLLNISKASAIVYSSKKTDSINKIRNNVSNVEYFIEMYSDKSLNDKDVGLNTIKNIGKQLVEKKNVEYDKVKIDKDEFKVLLFTSGTTSVAKGIMISNKNLTSNLSAIGSSVLITPNDRFFSVLPLHHTYESTVGFLVPIYSGGSVAVCQGLKSIVPNMQETSPTILIAVPVLLETLYRKINLNIKKSKKENLVNSMIHISNALKKVNIDIKRKVFSEIHKTFGGKLRLITSAAAPIDPLVGEWIEDMGMIFIQGYGLTETSPIAAVTPDFDTKVGSIGFPVKCAEIKINNPNENGEGEILIKSDTLMLGYYEAEELTKESVKDGWFNSGDVGYYDEKGYLYITGRIKNVIITNNGKNIYPEELEMLINQIEYVKESMVYGSGEHDDLKITARITLNEEYIEQTHAEKLSKEELHDIIWYKIKEINRTIPTYKAIKGLEIKDEDFVKTTTMKIRRKDELMQNHIES